MAQVATTRHHDVAYEHGYETAEVSGWTGWVGFGAFMMILTGMLNIINGLVGLYRDTFYVVSDNSAHLLVFQNLHTWGWINLIAGAIVMIAGFALFSGATWARFVAVLVAMASIAVNFVAIALYPVWAVIAITTAVIVMYAVIAHGGELRE